jgi:cyclophilin family peptidyl-prolyl cis-trans isomerase
VITFHADWNWGIDATRSVLLIFRGATHCYSFTFMASSADLRFLLLFFLVFSGMSPLAHAVAPVAPSNCIAVAVSATASNAAIGLRWRDNSTDETQWQLQVRVGNGPYTVHSNYFSNTSTSTGLTISIPLINAALDATYQYRVLAWNGTEISGASNVATVGTFDLAVPINFSVAVVDPFNVVMGWEEASTGEAGFAIERRLGSGPWELVANQQANILIVTPVDLVAPFGTYSFRIRAYKGAFPTTPDSPPDANLSAYSNEVTINVGPYTASATAVPGQTLVVLTWPNVFNEFGYRILYRASTQSGFSELGVVNANVSTVQVTAPDIEPAGVYSFVIQPVFDVGVVGESNVATATVDGMTSKTGTSGSPGDSFSHSFTQVTGSSVSSRALTGVPSGLSFDTATGILSGVYPSLGNYTLNYSAALANGGVLTQVFHIRVRPPAGAPVVATVIPAWSAVVGDSRDTPLAGTFSDAEAESAVRVNTTFGDMDFILFDTATPATVANFMNYLNAGKYADVAFHRSIAGFVIQGGGFKGAGTGSDFTSVATNPPVVNEPGIGNEYGTIAMAKIGGNPDSATSQFFVSLDDNRANLDYQNGGFTVFGRVAGDGMTVAEMIASLPKDTYDLFLDGSASATPFQNFPLNVPSMPAPMDQTKLAKINSVTTIPTLAYSITGNSNPSVATASIVGGQLRLVGLAGGQTTVTLTATDLDNLTSSQIVAVTILDTFGTWAARNTFPSGEAGIGQNPDGDEWSNLQEYAFLGDPAVAGSAPGTVDQGITGTSPKFLTLTFPVRKFTQGLSYAVEGGDGLSGPWTEVWKSTDGFAHSQVVTAFDQADRTVLTIKDNAAIGAGPKRFMRIRTVE